MRDHDGDVRSFTLYSEAWYGPQQLMSQKIVDEVNFGLNSPEGGTSGEMSVSWHDLSNGRPAPKLECFCDGWDALNSFSDVLAAMAEVDDEDISPKEFCNLLLRCGFVDKTPRENPYKKGEPSQKHLSREEMLEKALEGVLKLISICEHTSTHRGGAIWTICDDCGMQWADDEGGVQPYKEPAELTNALALLGKSR